jgi:hypothetical protein
VVIVLIHNPQNNQVFPHIENGTPEQALAVLQSAVQMVSQQLAGPKLFMPNGQAHVVASAGGEIIDPDGTA